MEEKWKEIEKYPNYEVSNMGRVRNKETKEILWKSYNVVIINKRFRNVAVMVLEAFKNVSMKYRTVYYVDDDYSNCALSNLSYKPFKRKKEKKKKIVQLTADGKYITTFPCLEKITIGRPQKIMAALNDWQFKTYLGFRWLYLDDYAEAVMSNSLHDSIEVRGDIVQLTLDGEYITTYQSGYEAATAIGNPHLGSNVILACRGKRKTCGGFKWKFKDDYMNDYMNEGN